MVLRAERLERELNQQGIGVSLPGMKGWAALGVLLGCVAFGACSVEVEDSDDDGGGTTSGDPTSGLVGAAGVTVSEVALYQGPKRLLAVAGAPQTPTVPLVRGRTALLRVFYATAPESVGKVVTGRLEIEGAEPLLAEATLAPASVEGDLGTTINFALPPELVGADGNVGFNYRVSVLEAGDSDNVAAHHPAAGFEAHAFEGAHNTLRVVVAPFAYNADGSGRLPDTSPERLEQLRARFLQLYPVSNVEVTVREPTQWNGTILPNGQGWQEVGLEVYGYRAQDGAADDVYYYGMFNPANTTAQFCSGGCLLGVTLLNDQPAETGAVDLRLALGVGFTDVGDDTATHEIGHAHGREHAPCGPGLDPSSIDQTFPHQGGGIGVWSWDVVGGGLIDPDVYTDLMGYCQVQWISDHNYAALFNRGKNVNQAKWAQPMDPNTLRHHDEAGDEFLDYELIAFDGETISWADTRMALPSSSHTVPLRVRAGAELTTAQGQLFRYDHLPGGWLFVPKGERTIDEAHFELDGVDVHAVRSKHYR